MSNPTPRGREVEARVNDRAVLDAARLVFAVHGPNAPVAAVAAEAGVGVGSLYRRYPSKDALLQFLCLESMRQLQAIGERAHDLTDSWEALDLYVREGVAIRAGAFASSAASIPATREMWTAAEAIHGFVTSLVERAQRAGVLRPDVTAFDIQLLIELFSRRRPDDGGAHERLLGLAIDGLSACPPCSELPGATPGWANYAGGWQRS